MEQGTKHRGGGAGGVGKITSHKRDQTEVFNCDVKAELAGKGHTMICLHMSTTSGRKCSQAISCDSTTSLVRIAVGRCDDAREMVHKGELDVATMCHRSTFYWVK